MLKNKGQGPRVTKDGSLEQVSRKADPGAQHEMLLGPHLMKFRISGMRQAHPGNVTEAGMLESASL